MGFRIDLRLVDDQAFTQVIFDLLQVFLQVQILFRAEFDRVDQEGVGADQRIAALRQLGIPRDLRRVDGFIVGNADGSKVRRKL